MGSQQGHISLEFRCSLYLFATRWNWYKWEGLAKVSLCWGLWDKVQKLYAVYAKMRPGSVQLSEAQFSSVQFKLFNLTNIYEASYHTWTRNQTHPHAQRLCKIWPCPSWTSFPSSNTHSFWSSLTGLLAVPCMAKNAPAPGPLHLLFSLPSKVFPQISTWLPASFPLGLCLNTFSLEKPSLTTFAEIVPHLVWAAQLYFSLCPLSLPDSLLCTHLSLSVSTRV